MAQDFGSNIIGHFTDFVIVSHNATNLARFANNETIPEDTAYLLAGNAWTASHAKYAMVMCQKLLAIALALFDSPVRFAGWIWDIQAFILSYPAIVEELITSAMMF